MLHAEPGPAPYSLNKRSSAVVGMRTYCERPSYARCTWYSTHVPVHPAGWSHFPGVRMLQPDLLSFEICSKAGTPESSSS